jgi:two-component system, OmpR family, sensor histidine kinase KdpD
MDRGERLGFWLPAGALGAMALGVALIPFRTLTSASNLAFVFLAYTIVVAELGGRLAALVTAVVAALSLNFFLTMPYLSLTIDKPEDLIAFVALTGCGLIAAKFGTRRARLSEASARVSTELGLLRRLAGQVRVGADLSEILADLRRALGFQAMVLRDEGGRVLAVAPTEGAPVEGARVELDGDSFLPVGEDRPHFGTRGLRVPARGGRIRLPTEHGLVSLDIWEGDPQGFDLDQWRTFAIALTILGLRLSGAHGRASA